MKVIKAVGFDYGGVMTGKPGSFFSNKVSNLLGISPEKYKEEYFKINHLPSTGKITWDEFWKMFVKKFHKEEKLDQLMGIVNKLHSKEVHEHMKALVLGLKRNGYKVGLLSNNTLEAITNFRNQGFYDLFDTVVVSAMVGYIKPDPEIFKLFINNLDVKAEELTFIDDSMNSLKSAKEVGFHPIHYISFEKLLVDLNPVF